MKLIEHRFSGVIIIEPNVLGDARGFFKETYRASRYAEAGIPTNFVQDNLSRSVKNTLRGLHFQEPQGQGKLVFCVRGAVWDVAVDIRKGSPTFGCWTATELTEDNHRQLWMPPGFAHGFCVLTDTADFGYKCTEEYRHEFDRGIAWDDPDIGIKWPVDEPLLSAKDQKQPRLRDAPLLPSF
jgi:dTDP-4-dehydrorhamnose 3,5-epimerase